MSIKNLADSIKAGKNVVPKKAEPKTVKANVEIPEYFENLKRELKEKKINTKVNTYIDKEIVEVLGLIKTRSKIPISSLLSHIVEEWIEKHKNEIKNLPTNKYL